jgi:hypothetical protein
MTGEHAEFPFDFWAKLAREDPGAFEEARKLMLDSLIEAAPARVRPRLKGIQWQIEHLRKRATTPLNACLKISDMMWTNVLDVDGLAVHLRGLNEGDPPPAGPRHSADVLPFQRNPAPP